MRMKILTEGHHERTECPEGTAVKLSCWNDLTPLSEGKVVVFNTLQRNAVLLTTDTYDALKQADLSGSLTVEGEEKKRLFALGILVRRDKDEHAAWNKAYREAKLDMSDLDITVVLTEQCQMGCVYCFEGLEKAHRVITDDTVERLLQFIRLHEEGLRSLRLTWFGGEPLLAYKPMRKLSERAIAYCKEHGIVYRSDITTNGFALNEKRITEMVEQWKIRTFIITVDGTAQVHNQRRPLRGGGGTFDTIWENVKRLMQHDVFVLLRITIDKRNADSVPELLDLMHAELPADKIQVAFCRTFDMAFTPKASTPYIYSEREFAEVEWKLMQYAHSLGIFRYRFPHAAPRGGCLRNGDLVVGPDGEIFKCLDTIGDTRRITGHLMQPSADAEPEWLVRWREWQPDNRPECRCCALQPLCNGGCPHNALFSDKKHGSDLPCPDWKANYKRQIIELAHANDESI